MTYELLAEQFIAAIAELAKGPAPHQHANSIRGEMGVLNCLAAKKECATVGELKEVVQVGSGRIADILKSLENKGLIRRSTSPNDKRKVVVSITQKGNALLFEKKKCMQDKTAQLMEFLGMEDSKDAIRILQRMREFKFEDTEMEEKEKRTDV